MSEQRPTPPLSEQLDDRGPRAFSISTEEWFDRGMLLRDYFAAAALTAIAPYACGTVRPFDGRAIGEECYRMADAMLAARKKIIG